MTRTSPIQASMSSGEISPLLHARYDYQRFQTGLKVCRGFLPLLQGGVTRAPGTWYRGQTKDNARARLIDFEFAENDAVTLEFTDGVMRVWRYADLVQSGGQPFELVTPYLESDLDNLQWVQAADVIYIVDGRQAMQKLSRFALDNWTIAPAEFKDGPFRVESSDDAVTVQASAQTGSITLTGVGDPFAANMVGTLLRLRPADNRDVALWVGNQAISVGDLRRYDGNTYRLISGDNTKVNPPVHLTGQSKTDGEDDVVWEFVNDDVGVVRIATFTDANTVQATVIQTVPSQCVTQPTRFWAEGAWSARHGYPAAIEIFEQRLVAAATSSDPRTVWFSGIGIFDDFAPSVSADGSFAYDIAGDGSRNRIIWLRRGKNGLHVGALGEEYSSGSTSNDQAIGPTTTRFDIDSTYGSLPVRPIAPDGKPIFITKDGSRLIELAYAFQSQGNDAKVLSLPSEHLGQNGFVEIVWQSAPLRLSWIRMKNGDLAVMIYDTSEDVLGWAVYPLAGGFVESMAVSAGLDASSDTLSLCVRREINGQTVRCFEQQALFYGQIAGNTPIHEANHLFGAVLFEPAVSETVFAVPHLVGESVYAWTDQGTEGPFVVPASGEVTLENPAVHVTIGKNDDTQRALTLDVMAAARDGSSLGRDKRVNSNSGIALHKTAAGRVEVITQKFGEEEKRNGDVALLKGPIARDQTTAYSGLVQTTAISRNASQVFFEFTPEGPAPITILALAPQVEEVGA